MDSLDKHQKSSTSIKMEKSPCAETIKEMEDEANIELRNTDVINETQTDPKSPIPKQQRKTELVNCKVVSEKKKCEENKYEIYDVNVPDTNPFQRRTSILVYMNTRMTPVPTEGEPLVYDPHSRNDFVRFVFTLTFIMVMVTISFTAAGNFIEPLRDFLTSPVGMIIGICCVIFTFLFHYVMFCSNCSRSPPMNYICLVLATIVWSYLVAWITMRYKFAIIIGAFVATAAIAFVCMLLAMSSFDFTKYLLYFILISVALSVVMLVFFLAKFFFDFYMKPLHIVLLIAVVIMDAVMFTVELQMILGGKTVELGVDDYALGAYMLYISLIELFLLLLKLINVIDS